MVWSEYCKCGGVKKHCEKYDAYYCTEEDKWLETGCSDRTCDTCRGRPERPSQVNSG